MLLNAPAKFGFVVFDLLVNLHNLSEKSLHFSGSAEICDFSVKTLTKFSRNGRVQPGQVSGRVPGVHEAGIEAVDAAAGRDNPPERWRRWRQSGKVPGRNYLSRFGGLLSYILRKMFLSMIHDGEL